VAGDIKIGHFVALHRLREERRMQSNRENGDQQEIASAPGASRSGR
jgi:hypothetical protein